MRLVLYAVIFIAAAVAFVVWPLTGWQHTVAVVAGIVALLVVGRVFGRPWGRL